ncbi:hypothetical protein H5410_052721 [Solanum commersonii]|uniref:Uncharacterized protein n=1 Tax=Solanum commersonii TaxID=4109 RepID=A0A9J5X4E2_SOLCO|nr:hypothetical protein H5410_052721 [Solanum commersonii]
MDPNCNEQKFLAFNKRRTRVHYYYPKSETRYGGQAETPEARVMKVKRDPTPQLPNLSIASSPEVCHPSSLPPLPNPPPSPSFAFSTFAIRFDLLSFPQLPTAFVPNLHSTTMSVSGSLFSGAVEGKSSCRAPVRGAEK